MFGVMNHLDVVLCKDADEAIAKGFVYNLPDFESVEIDKVIVIKSGTESGKSTVDIILKDKSGKKFVVMVTGMLLKSIPC